MNLKAEKQDGFTSSVGSLKELLGPSLGKGKPQIDRLLDVDLNEIEEDPDQPRTEFDDDFLKSLAEDIRQRGVKTPISIKSGINKKYMINSGANRYRASIIAGKKTIPAVLDSDHDSYDQVSENIKRKSLSALDLAKWLQNRLDEGDTREEITNRLNISKSFISEHVSILKIPERIMTLVYYTGIVTKYSVLNKISLCHKINSEKTYEFCKTVSETGGASIKEVKEFKKSLKKSEKTFDQQFPEKSEIDSILQEKKESGELSEQIETETETPINTGIDKLPNSLKPKQKKPRKKDPVILVQHDDKDAILLYKKLSDNGQVWVEYEDGKENQVPAGEVRIITIQEMTK